MQFFLRVPHMDNNYFLLGFDGTLTTGRASIVHYYMLQYMLEHKLERLTCVTTFLKHKCCFVYSKKLYVPHKLLKLCYLFKYKQKQTVRTYLITENRLGHHRK